ncbi:DNA-binding protein [Bacillus thuringiensis]|uniref:DNA-binding protein n=2 Tax=Bacillus thuringiensis TaxID=1428 RepID=A0A9X6TIZ2_BACTU|nr:DNA-binding protein [Bacillus thuringiensis]
MRTLIMNQLLEIATVAKLLKCNKNKVYELIKSGQLQGLKLGRMKVTTMEIDSFLERNLGKDLSDPYNVKDLNKSN